MDRDELSGIEPGELRLKTLRVDPVRSADVLRLEAPRLARREVSQDDERSDRRDFRDGPLVAHDIALLEGRQADEGRDPVDLAALPLTNSFGEAVTVPPKAPARSRASPLASAFVLT